MWQWDSLSIKAAGCWVVAIGGKLVLWISGSPIVPLKASGPSIFFDLMGGAAIICTGIWLIRWLIRRAARLV